MIKNIIFDFGDIFINLDKQATFVEMAKLGVTKISDEMIGVYHQYEKGLMTTDEFIDFFYKKLIILLLWVLVEGISLEYGISPP